MEKSYLIARIREALAHQVGELSIDVAVERDVVRLAGVVSTLEHRRRVEEIVLLLCAGHSLESRIAIRPPLPPREPEHLS
jgi:hypothetical protein